MKYSREDACRAWITYANLKADILCDIIREYGSCSNLYDCFLDSDCTCLNAYLTPEATMTLRTQATQAKMHEMLVKMQQYDMAIMSIDDDIYPDSLRNIIDPPALLFYRGDPSCLKNRCVTMVGTRKASKQGLEASTRIAKELSEAGISIVSGLALGIDSAALQGGLIGGSPVIGVAACGLDVNYPEANSPMRKSIIEEGGVLVSEYPPESPALRWHFQVRNRLMAGLGRVLLMMEAPIRSGSMITVHHALDQGKDVYAYPGDPKNPHSEGAHTLLREGALFFSSSKHILEDTKWDAITVPRKVKKKAPPESVATASKKKKTSSKPDATSISTPSAPMDTKKKTPAISAEPEETLQTWNGRTYVPDHSARNIVMERMDTVIATQRSEMHKLQAKAKKAQEKIQVSYAAPKTNEVLEGELSPLQIQIYRLLDDGAKSFDELAAATGVNAQVLFGALSMLQLTRNVAALPGKLYRQILEEIED